MTWPSFFANSPEFQRLVSGAEDVRLARIALEIARDAYPDLDVESYLKRIEEFADRARSRFRPGALVRDIIGQINWVLYVEEGIGGNWDEYYDPRNSYLNEVLDRRLGIPISLSVIYWSVAEHLGLAGGGCQFAGAFHAARTTRRTTPGSSIRSTEEPSTIGSVANRSSRRSLSNRWSSPMR